MEKLIPKPQRNFRTPSNSSPQTCFRQLTFTDEIVTLMFRLTHSSDNRAWTKPNIPLLQYSLCYAVHAETYDSDTAQRARISKPH